MKVIIAGGRDYRHTPKDESWLADLDREHEWTEVVSGGAGGADRFGEQWARENQIPVKVFPADWAKHGKAAGPIRNRQMADYVGPGGMLVVFPGGRGTANMIQEADSRGLKVVKSWEATS